MKVADIMKTDLKTIAPDSSVADLVSLQAEEHISGVPVVDQHGRLIGVASTSDVLQAVADAASPEERESVFENTMVRDIMTPRPLTLTPEATVIDAARQMLYLEVHRLFVEADGELAGVISQTDIVGAVAAARI